MLVYEIQRKKRMPEVVKHAHENHEVELLTQRADLVNRQFSKLNIGLEHFCREPRLVQILVVEIHRNHAFGSPTFHFERVEAGIAANIQNALPGQIRRKGMGEVLKLK